jgi:molybdate transport system ATP-binding protein
MLKADLLKRRDGFTLRAQFEAPTPGVVALFGRSGCGKTTLVDLISGLLEPDEGIIQLNGTVLTDTRSGIAVPVERRRIGYVFQDPRLFPHFTVLGNLLYGRKRAAAAGPAAPAAATPAVPSSAAAPGATQSVSLEEIVALLGIESLLKRRPHELSGGERQRVSLGRALLSQPSLLLLDEPLAALDAARREEVLPYLEALRDRLSIPMVYVSHQFEEVLRLATHVVVMDAGSVIAQGSLNEVSLAPELRAIVGPDAVGAVLDGKVLSVDSERGMADLRLGSGVFRVSIREARVGSLVRIQVLARDIILATQPTQGLSVRNSLEGRIVALANDGQDEAVLVTVDIGGATLLSRVTHEAVDALGLRAGLHVWALVKAVSTRGHAYFTRQE